MLTKDELKDWLERHGYRRDAYGNYKKTRASGRVVRFKLKRLVVRYECRYSDPSLGWFKLRSAYYKDLRLTEDDKLGGLT